jgi:hypothetical protein
MKLPQLDEVSADAKRLHVPHVFVAHGDPIRRRAGQVACPIVAPRIARSGRNR